MKQIFKLLSAFVFVFFLSACAAPNKHIYPRTSEEADIILNLHSNIERTTFKIDGKIVGVGRRIKVLIDNREHTISAHPEGYISKEEFVQPPYRSGYVLTFTFLLGERMQEGKNLAIQSYIDGTDTSPIDTLPSIIIFHPDISRGLIAKTSEKTFILKGRAYSANGLSVLFINGNRISFDEKGSFSVDINLKEGNNDITILAVDKFNRQVERNIVISTEPLKKEKILIKGKKIKIGIIEFQNINEEAKKDSLGLMFSEMLTTAFVNSEAFQIAEREQLQKVTKELQLSQSGIIDTSQAKQLGKMVGADAIVTGSVTNIGTDLRLDARIIDVQSGIILTAEKIIGKTDLHSISSMADLIVDNLVNKFYRDKKH